MKLVINIPDKAYNRLLEEQHLPNRLDIEYFIVHGTSLEAELEEIKAEIDALYGVYNSHFKERLVIKTDVMQILDKHIAELKGE